MFVYVCFNYFCICKYHILYSTVYMLYIMLHNTYCTVYILSFILYILAFNVNELVNSCKFLYVYK
jgi:hypothetical protein